MLKLLLVSATTFEIQPTLDFLRLNNNSGTSSFQLERLNLDVCITGVGMVNTAFELGKLSGRKYDYAINAGIAGSFKALPLGTVVNVTEDCFSELGAENGGEFIKIDELGFGTQERIITNSFTSEIIRSLPQASGITVNKVHGDTESIAKIIRSHNPDIESMEGAAFMQAVNVFGWRAAQIRSISNVVEKRNRDNWNLPLAIQKLNTVLLDLIAHLNDVKDHENQD